MEALRKILGIGSWTFVLVSIELKGKGRLRD